MYNGKYISYRCIVYYSQLMDCKFFFRLTAYFVQLSQLYSVELHGTIASWLTLACLLTAVIASKILVAINMH